MIYGYARVSSKEQNEARQLDALHAVPVDRIFLDRQSGKDFDRPQWRSLMRHLRQGDTLYMLSLDRMGRNYGEIQEQWRKVVNDIKADIVILDMEILDTRKGAEGLTGRFVADLVLQILAYVAQTEREKIRERQKQGIQAAKARGTRCGRPPDPLPGNWRDICVRLSAGEITIKQAAEESGFRRTTFATKYRKWRQADDSDRMGSAD